MIMAAIAITTSPPTTPPAIAPTFDCVEAVELAGVEAPGELEPADAVEEPGELEPADAVDAAATVLAGEGPLPFDVVAAAMGAVVVGTVAGTVVGVVAAPESTVVCAILFTG